MDPPDFPYPPPDTCHLCGTPLPDPGSRCPACGMHPARVLSRSDKVLVGAGLLGLYVFVAIMLAITR